MKRITIAAVLMMMGFTAHADIAAPLWACKLNARVQDSSFSIILGVVHIQGQGTVRCTSVLGQHVSRQAVVEIVGLSFGPDIQFPTGQAGELEILSVGAGLSSVNAMYGEYSLNGSLNADAGFLRFGLKRDISVTPQIPDGGIATSLAVTLEEGATLGLGLNHSITGMSIMTPAQARAKWNRP